jgi:hypothetical protein
LSIAYNLFNGKGFSRDFIDLGAHQLDNNIPTLMNYDQISNHLRNKLPLYFVLLGGWLSIFKADFGNWYYYGTLFNFFLCSISIVLFYFFIKKNFNWHISLLSTLFLAIIPGMVWFSVRIRPDILAFLFVLLSFYFALKKISYENAIIIGIFSALAHFSHTTGVLPGLAISIYFIIKKQYKATILLVCTWIGILIPWMARNYIVFGDALQGTGIPIPRNIAISLGLISPEAPNLNINELGPLAGISISNTIEGLIAEFSNIYGMQSFLIFISFSIFSYVTFSTLRQIASSRRNKILLLSAILIYSFIIIYTLDYKSQNTDLDIQLIFLFIIPSLLFIFIKLNPRYGNILTSGGSNAILLITIYVLLSFIPYFMFAQVTGRVTPETRIIIQSLYMLIPLSILGIWKIIDRLTYVSNLANRKQISFIAVSIIMISTSIVLFSSGISSINSFQQRYHEELYQTEMNDWIIENISPGSKVASDLPHAVLLRTGLESVNFANAFKDNLAYEKWIIKKFDIDYLVFYYYKNNGIDKPLLNTDLEEMKLEMVYRGENGGLIYKVVPNS